MSDTLGGASAGGRWKASPRILALVQLGAGALAGAALAAWGLSGALSLFCGSALMAGAQAWIGRGLRRAPLDDPQAARKALLAGAVMRFLAMLAALAVAYGLGLWLPMVAAGMFVAMLASWLWMLVHLRMNH